ncbi:hypothetical protein [Streptomyces sp. NPDC005181]|uniref:hypothetical protein n=1 Tax=Streptomyces sp. NPDC005181 TaxID=3156869 RepID=UPI0033B7BBE5
MSFCAVLARCGPGGPQRADADRQRFPNGLTYRRPWRFLLAVLPTATRRRALRWWLVRALSQPLGIHVFGGGAEARQELHNVADRLGRSPKELRLVREYSLRHPDERTWPPVPRAVLPLVLLGLCLLATAAAFLGHRPAARDVSLGDLLPFLLTPAGLFTSVTAVLVGLIGRPFVGTRSTNTVLAVGGVLLAVCASALLRNILDAPPTYRLLALIITVTVTVPFLYRAQAPWALQLIVPLALAACVPLMQFHGEQLHRRFLAPWGLAPSDLGMELTDQLQVAAPTWFASGFLLTSLLFLYAVSRMANAEPSRVLIAACLVGVCASFGVLFQEDAAEAEAAGRALARASAGAAAEGKGWGAVEPEAVCVVAQDDWVRNLPSGPLLQLGSADGKTVLLDPAAPGHALIVPDGAVTLLKILDAGDSVTCHTR